MELLTEQDCPHCKKTFESKVALNNLELKQPEAKIKQVQESPEAPAAAAAQETQVREVEKIVEKVKVPKDTPFFKCKDCGDKHPNPNYSEVPRYRCPNCGTLNGQKNCKNCNKITDSDDWEELDDDEREELGIPIPENHNNHDHEHDTE